MGGWVASVGGGSFSGENTRDAVFEETANDAGLVSGASIDAPEITVGH
ncbi:MAG: hypothetical protein ABJO29_02350 [Yoonia sp.]